VLRYYIFLRTFSKAPTVQHIKSHQDKQTAYGKGTLPAQLLSIDADRLASSFDYTSFKPTTSTILFTVGNNAQLHIKDSTIISNYGPVI
jgi:hypothetical protein